MVSSTLQKKLFSTIRVIIIPLYAVHCSSNVRINIPQLPYFLKGPSTTILENAEDRHSTKLSREQRHLTYSSRRPYIPWYYMYHSTHYPSQSDGVIWFQSYLSHPTATLISNIQLMVRNSSASTSYTYNELHGAIQSITDNSEHHAIHYSF